MLAAHRISNLQKSLISRAQAARMAGVSQRTLDGWLASGKLPAFKLGGRVLIDPADVRAMLRPKTPSTPSLFAANEQAGPR